MKRITWNLWVIIAIAMVAFIFATSCTVYIGGDDSDNADSQDLFSITEDGVLTVKDLSQISADVEIPSTVDGITVKSIGERAFKDCKTITSVTIPDTVETIEHSAFGYCSNLKSVVLPDSIKTIEAFAFTICYNLKIDKLPSSIETIGSCAFQSCSVTGTIEIPSSMKSLDSKAFANCWVSSFVVDSGNSVYASQDGVVFTKDMEKIVVTPRGLSEFTIPETVKTISPNCFSGCSNLKALIIPSSLTEIGERVVEGCSSLELTVDSENTCFKVVDGVLYDYEIEKLLWAPEYLEGTFTIPSTVKTVNGYAFFDCEAKKIVIPDSVKEIGSYSFWSSNITEIEIPSSISVISNSAFYWCQSLTTVHIPSSVTKIEARAFQDCSSLKDIYYDGSLDDWKLSVTIVDKSWKQNINKDCVVHFNDQDVSISEL